MGDLRVSDALNAILIALIGSALPQASETGAMESSRKLSEFGRRMGALEDDIDYSVKHIGDSLPGDAGRSYVRAISVLTGAHGGTNYLREYQNSLKNVAAGHRDQSLNIQESKWQIIAELIRLVIELTILAATAWINPAAAGEAAEAKARSTAAFLTTLDLFLRRTHVMPSLSEALEEAFQALVVRLGLMAFNAPDMKPSGVDWGAIGQNAAIGGAAGWLSGPLRGAADRFNGLFGREMSRDLTKDVSGDLTSKVGRDLPSGTNELSVLDRVLRTPGKVSEFVADGLTEALPETLLAMAFYGVPFSWSSFATSFWTAGVSERSESLLHRGVGESVGKVREAMRGAATEGKRDASTLEQKGAAGEPGYEVTGSQASGGPAGGSGGVNGLDAPGGLAGLSSPGVLPASLSTVSPPPGITRHTAEPGEDTRSGTPGTVKPLRVPTASGEHTGTRQQTGDGTHDVGTPADSGSGTGATVETLAAAATTSAPVAPDTQRPAAASQGAGRPAAVASSEPTRTTGTEPSQSNRPTSAGTSRTASGSTTVADTSVSRPAAGTSEGTAAAQIPAVAPRPTATTEPGASRVSTPPSSEATRIATATAHRGEDSSRPAAGRRRATASGGTDHRAAEPVPDTTTAPTTGQIDDLRPGLATVSGAGRLDPDEDLYRTVDSLLRQRGVEADRDMVKESRRRLVAGGWVFPHMTTRQLAEQIAVDVTSGSRVDPARLRGGMWQSPGEGQQGHSGEWQEAPGQESGVAETSAAGMSQTWLTAPYGEPSGSRYADSAATGALPDGFWDGFTAPPVGSVGGLSVGPGVDGIGADPSVMDWARDPGAGGQESFGSQPAALPQAFEAGIAPQSAAAGDNTGTGDAGTGDLFGSPGPGDGEVSGAGNGEDDWEGDLFGSDGEDDGDGNDGEGGEGAVRLRRVDPAAAGAFVQGLFLPTFEVPPPPVVVWRGPRTGREDRAAVADVPPPVLVERVLPQDPQSGQWGRVWPGEEYFRPYRWGRAAQEIVPRDEVPGLLAVLTGPQAYGTWTDESVADALAEAGLSLEKDRYPHLRHLYIAAVVQETVDWLQQHGPDTAAEAWWLSRVRDLFVQQGTGVTAEPGPVSLLGQEYPVDLHGWLQGVAAGRTALTPQTLQALERTGYTTQGSERLRAAEEARDDKARSGLTVGEVVDHLRRFYQHNRHAKADQLPGSDWTVSAGGRDISLGRWLRAISRGRAAVAPPTFARLREAGLPEADEILFLPPTPPHRRAGVDPFQAARALSHHYENNPTAQGKLPSQKESLKGAGAPDVPGKWFYSVYSGATGVSVEGVEALIAAGLPTTIPGKPSAIRRTVSAQALQALRDHYAHQGQEPDAPLQDPPADTEFIDASGTTRSLTQYIGHLRTHNVQLPSSHGLPAKVVTHLQLNTHTRRAGIDPFHAARALHHYYRNNTSAQNQLPSRKDLLTGAGAPDVPGKWFRNVYSGATGVSVEGAEALIAAGLPTTIPGNKPSAIRRTVSTQALQALHDHYAHQDQEPDAPLQDPPADAVFIDASGTTRSLTEYIGHLRNHGVQLPEGHRLPDKVVTHLQLGTHTHTRRTGTDPFHAARALSHYYENNPTAQGKLPSDDTLLTGAGAPIVNGKWFRNMYNGTTGVSVEGAEALIAAGLPTTIGNKPSNIRRTVSAQALQALYDHYIRPDQEPDGPVQDLPADAEFIDASGTSRSLTEYIGHLRNHGVQLPEGHRLPDKVVTHLQLGTHTHTRRVGIDPFHAARALRHYYRNDTSTAGKLPPESTLLTGAGAPTVPGKWFRSVYSGETGVSVEGVEALIAAGLPTTIPGNKPSAIRRAVSAQALQALRDHYAHQDQEPDAPVQDPPADTEFIDASGTSRSLTEYIGHLRNHGVQLPSTHGLPDEVVTHLQLNTHARRAGLDPFHAARALRHYYRNDTSSQVKLPSRNALLTGAGVPDVPGKWFHNVYNGTTGVSVEGAEALIAAGLPTAAGKKPSAIRRTVSAQALQALRDHYAHQGQEPDVQDPPADAEFIDASGTSRSLTEYIGHLRNHGIQLPKGHGLPDRVVTHLQLSTPTQARHPGIDPFHAARALRQYYDNNSSAQEKLPADDTLLTGADAPTVNGRWFRNVYNGTTGVSVEGAEALIAAGLPTTIGNKPSAIRRTVSAQALQALRDHYAHQGREPDAPIQDPPADTEFIDASGTSRSLNAYIGLLRTHGVQLPSSHGLPDKVVAHLQLSTPTRAVGDSTRKRKAPADSSAPAAKRKRAAGRQGTSARPADPVVAGLPGTSSPSGESFPTGDLDAPPPHAPGAGSGGRSAAGHRSASGSMPYEPGAPLAGPSDQVLDSPGVGVGSWGLFGAHLPDAGFTVVAPPGPEPAATSDAGSAPHSFTGAHAPVSPHPVPGGTVFTSGQNAARGLGETETHGDEQTWAGLQGRGAGGSGSGARGSVPH
ncbi:hypothetical protein ABZX30_32600 [Streptomyces sp. NPDC004542]|uniref:hypothetical protein n=1 Tax=Streptomyces sp. NPDC004542 TaxID=3154281 RepID=UPI0033A1AA1F